LDATAKLFWVNPFGDLSKNRFSGAHFDSLALSLLRKNRKPSSYRSHLKTSQSLLFSTRLFIHNLAKPDDSDSEEIRFIFKA
jgi:hypothetical protein